MQVTNIEHKEFTLLYIQTWLCHRHAQERTFVRSPSNCTQLRHQQQSTPIPYSMCRKDYSCIGGPCNRKPILVLAANLGQFYPPFRQPSINSIQSARQNSTTFALRYVKLTVIGQILRNNNFDWIIFLGDKRSHMARAGVGGDCLLVCNQVRMWINPPLP